MKLIKKIAAIMFSFMMVFSLGTNVKAESGTSTDTRGSIKITNAIKNQDYKIYKILDLESFDSTQGAEAYSYKLTNDAWKNFFKTGAGKNYTTFDENDYVTWKSGVSENDAANLAKAAMAYAKDANNGVAAVTVTPTKQDNGNETETLTYSDLELGYYLVDSSVGTLCGLTTTKSKVDIIEKNGVPTVEKDIIHNNEYVKNNYANIGDVIKFQTFVHVKRGAKNYVLHDKMSKGLVLNDNINEGTQLPATTLQVYASDDEASFFDTLKNNVDYELVKENDGFTVTFKPEYLKQHENVNYTINVTYSATLTKDAEITFTDGVNANKNKTWLTYGDKNTSSNESETITYTFGVPVLKYTGAKKPLADAQFTLYENDGVTKIQLIQADNINRVPTYRKFIEGDNENDKVTNIKTDANGKFNITGLNLGTYYLEETIAPNGYNKLTAKIKVTVTKDGTDGATFVRLLQNSADTNVINVENKTGSILPSTGGMGTTLIYLIGGALVLGSGIVLANKKRAKAK